MIDIQEFTGPFGIPVLYQRMPEMVEAVAVSWVVFTGAADDESIGKPGLYHWFEHVPLRGTSKYSGGYNATKGWAVPYDGYVNAYTNEQRTMYVACVPKEVWRKALSVITDLFAQPLVREKDVRDERDVIRIEIAGAKAIAEKSSQMMLQEILYGGHPFGHHTLGTEETLDEMDASTLRRAYKMGYDRSRAMLVVTGDITKEDLLKELSRLADLLPNHGLSERRIAADRGELPSLRSGQTTVIETEFSSSIVYMLFPFKKESALDAFVELNLLSDLFHLGMLSSPLYRILREERKLVYRTYCVGRFNPAKNYFGFFAETKSKSIDAVIKAFQDVANDSWVRSKTRLEEVQRGRSYSFKMNPFDSLEYVETTIARHLMADAPVNDTEFAQRINSYGIGQVSEMLDGLKPESAHTIIFKGK